MKTITFTGSIYRGADGKEDLHLRTPGEYEVSDEKAVQVTRDFPEEFSLAHQVEEKTDEKAPDASSEPAESKTVETQSKETKTPKKGS